MSLELGRRAVVRDVSFTLAGGEVLAVVGPNGAGKTSLLEAVVGLQRGMGEVRFEGRSLRTFADRARVFSYGPDEPSPPSELRVADVVAHALACGGASSLAVELSASLRIDELRDATVAALSRGERKRVALFAALCTKKPVIVLDEPFGAFDPLQVREVLEVVKRRAVAGSSVLVTVHQLADAEKVADRILLLARGRAVATGSMRELRACFDAASATLEDIFVKALAGDRDAAP